MSKEAPSESTSTSGRAAAGARAEQAPGEGQAADSGTRWLGLARWQVVSLGVAALVAIAGLCLMGAGALTGGGEAAAAGAAGPSASGGASGAGESGAAGEPGGGAGGLAPNSIGPNDQPGDFPGGGGDDETGEQPRSGEGAEGQPPASGIDRWLETWSPAIFRLGFSFFVGFAVAYAVRGIIKLVVIFAGLLFLTLFVLQYADLVVVNWELMEQRYDELTAWLRREFSGVMSFARGYLPSAASGAGGLVVGFRRK